MTVYVILVTAFGAALVPGALMLLLERRERGGSIGAGRRNEDAPGDAGR